MYLHIATSEKEQVAMRKNTYQEVPVSVRRIREVIFGLNT